MKKSELIEYGCEGLSFIVGIHLVRQGFAGGGVWAILLGVMSLIGPSVRYVKKVGRTWLVVLLGMLFLGGFFLIGPVMLGVILIWLNDQAPVANILIALMRVSLAWWLPLLLVLRALILPPEGMPAPESDELLPACLAESRQDPPPGGPVSEILAGARD
jgi:MFS family permease